MSHKVRRFLAWRPGLVAEHNEALWPGMLVALDGDGPMDPVDLAQNVFHDLGHRLKNANVISAQLWLGIKDDSRLNGDDGKRKQLFKETD